MVRVVFFLGLVLICLDSYSQKESTWWYFYRNAGIQFSNGTPVADINANDSASSYVLGANSYGGGNIASISNRSTGQLLFYASAIGVFNRNHRSMPNGLPLMTSPYQSTNIISAATEEGTIIVPKPGHNDKFYFFHTRTATDLYEDGHVSGLFFSLIDMELDNGLGDVVDTLKNVYIIDSTEEKISATPHANGIDYWLMVRQGGTNNYHAFLITENGISATPVTTSIGLASSSYGTQEGNLRFNHQGNMLANVRGGDLL